MFSTRVDVTLLAPRLDAEHYDPVLLRMERLARDCGLPRTTLDDVVRTADAPITYGIVQPGELVAPGAGIRLIRCTDLGGLSVALDDLIWVSHEIDRPYRRSRVLPGDVLVGIAGSVGVVGIAPKSIEPANLNQSVARIRCESRMFGAWVAAFLTSRYGQAILERRAVGSVQQHLNIADLPEVPIPRPPPQVSDYIGSKVRQAEVLRELASDAETGARGGYRSQIGSLGNTDLPFQRSFRAKLSERLDPSYYEPRYASILDSGWLANCSEPLGTLIIDGSYGCLPESGSYGEGTETLLRATDLDDCNWNPAAGIRVPADQVAAKALVSEHNLLLEVKGAMTRCVVADGLSVGSYVNGTVYRFSTSIHPGYLAVHLTESIKRLYCSRESVNNIIQYLNLDAIQRLPVVRLDEAVEKEIGDGYLRSTASRGFASLLITAARLLVEALIERKVTEAGLITASKDPAADRALLSRLAEDGLDGSGRALFSDLDALQALLTEATERS